MKDNIDIKGVISHIRNYSYMSGIERDKLRIKQTSEIFTPTKLVKIILKKLKKMDKQLFIDPDKTFLDNSCGDGQFLGEIIIMKMQHGSTFEQALSTTYGVDIMRDNVELCKERLLCNQSHLKHIVDKNIVCADALTYHYRFDGSMTIDEIYKGLFEDDK